MKIFRKILKIILPKNYFNKIEEESKIWFFKCACGFEKSVWEAGGLRAWAFPKIKSVLGYCPVCKKFRILKLIKKI